MRNIPIIPDPRTPMKTTSIGQTRTI